MRPAFDSCQPEFHFFNVSDCYLPLQTIILKYWDTREQKLHDRGHEVYVHLWGVFFSPKIEYIV